MSTSILCKLRFVSYCAIVNWESTVSVPSSLLPLPFNNQWWLCCVLEKDSENVQAINSVCFIRLVLVDHSNILIHQRLSSLCHHWVVLLVEPRGRTYTMPQNVNKAASAILKDTTSTRSDFFFPTHVHAQQGVVIEFVCCPPKSSKYHGSSHFHDF